MCAGAGQAADYTVGNLQIANPWTRATPKGSTVAGGYMVITNKGTAPDRLLGRFGNRSRTGSKFTAWPWTTA